MRYFATVDSDAAQMSDVEEQARFNHSFLILAFSSPQVSFFLFHPSSGNGHQPHYGIIWKCKDHSKQQQLSIWQIHPN